MHLATTDVKGRGGVERRERVVTHLRALVPLLAKAPQKILAVSAERGLTEEPSNELVVVHHVHLAPLHRPLALTHSLLLHKLGWLRTCGRHGTNHRVGGVNTQK